MKEQKDFVGLRLRHSLLERIDAFHAEYHKHDRTEAIADLLELALHVVQKREMIRDPAIVSFMKENLYNEKIVDWFSKLDDDRIDALYGALRSEKDIRLRSKVQNRR